jgi:formylglycine-generating enzyme required for sulfatase activity
MQETNNSAILTWIDNPKILDLNASTWQGVFPKKNEPKEGFKFIAPVNSHPENYIDVHDIARNIWELTSDLFNVNHYKKLDTSKPINKTKGASKSY